LGCPRRPGLLYWKGGTSPPRDSTSAVHGRATAGEWKHGSTASELWCATKPATEWGRAATPHAAASSRHPMRRSAESTTKSWAESAASERSSPATEGHPAAHRRTATESTTEWGTSSERGAATPRRHPGRSAVGSSETSSAAGHARGGDGHAWGGDARCCGDGARGCGGNHWGGRGDAPGAGHHLGGRDGAGWGHRLARGRRRAIRLCAVWSVSGGWHHGAV